MKKICLITHAEATHSVEGKVGGWFDSKLTDKGKVKAASLVKNIARLGFELDTMTVYCSDLTRAVQTAEIVLADSNLPLNLDPRLREMSFGTHEGMCQKEHDKIIIPTSPIGDRLGHRICDGAESRRDVAIRVADFVDEIMHLDGGALVITHGFAASFVIAAFQKLDIESMGHLAFKLTPGSISVLVVDDLFENRTVSLLNA
ncbi:histidine phosphatase family protein [Pseudoalteromonas sp. MMG005]|uniref:histidine phosphatase family protein n=1 Tax=Pseudoalteromonas sp. MMG005 TaxID=2822682 RepID=UPI001B39E5D5|nr:histidine phosphatase family protein [Pseudoalteromonas sp. MMG005]